MAPATASIARDGTHCSDKMNVLESYSTCNSESFTSSVWISGLRAMPRNIFPTTAELSTSLSPCAR